MEVLHLDYRPKTGGIVGSLQTRLMKSSSAKLRERYDSYHEVGLGAIGSAVATRLALVLRVSFRLGILLKRLRDEIEETGRVGELLDNGWAFVTPDSRIFYDICVTVDACYFEFRSFYEIVGKYVIAFCKEMLDREVSEKELIQVLEDAGVDTSWIEPVKDTRKLFFHETAPWIALRIHERSPLVCSLLVLKENVHTFDDADKYITQDQLVDAIEGLQKASWEIHNWLVLRIEEVEELESA